MSFANGSVIRALCNKFCYGGYFGNGRAVFGHLHIVVVQGISHRRVYAAFYGRPGAEGQKEQWKRTLPCAGNPPVACREVVQSRITPRLQSVFSP